LVIITDDQGWGDFGVNGNAKIRTPNLDRLARESVQLSQFYVSPVCAPTRASIMTGRYNYRTGVVDTYQGRAIMHPDEVTLAELLSVAGYRTGIFGKWHLGDHYPCRAIDQGFREALVIAGGGIAQPSDPPQGSSYFDPWLEHNGKPVQAKGYCSDIFADAAIAHINASADAQQPSFTYLAFNAPHVPLQVADDLVKPYREAMLDEPTAKVYAMITNIDANVGRVLAALEKRKLVENTFVIFLTDNGPQTRRFNGKFRDAKGSVYEGGIHVPCFMRWPAKFQGGATVERMAAHIDLMPTILAACGVDAPRDVKLDGINLLSTLSAGGREDGIWPERTLYLQWHRGDTPDAGRCCAAISQRYKLVQPLGTAEGPAPKDPRWELYDLIEDPGETRDLAMMKPEVLVKMRDGYRQWFADVSATRGFDPIPIHVGSDHENPVLLTRQDLRGSGPKGQLPGFWEIQVERGGDYNAHLLFDKAGSKSRAVMKIGDVTAIAEVSRDVGEAFFPPLHLPAGETKLEASIDGKPVSYVEIKR
jgi:arylsulfatase A-like enzyme